MTPRQNFREVVFWILVTLVCVAVATACVALPAEINYTCEHEIEQVGENTAESMHTCERED